MKHLLSLAMLSMLPLSALADEPPAPDLTLVPAMARTLYATPGAKGLTPEQQTSQKQAAALLKQIDLHPQLQGPGSGVPDFSNLQQRGTSIADAALAQDRDKILSFLGIDQAKQGKLYYFVSLSMPDSLLKAYALQAMWDGGVLVLKGIGEGMDVREFIVKRLMPLVQFKGGSAEIVLDPRLFDLYQVATVPTIVYTEVSDTGICGVTTKIPFTYNKQTLEYAECATADPAKYWKLTGAVTSDYALDTFVSNGATGAQRFRDALARASISGIPDAKDGKAQEGFAGNWDEVLTPVALEAIHGALSADSASETYVFPTSSSTFGLATGPKGLNGTVDGKQVMVPLSEFQKK